MARTVDSATMRQINKKLVTEMIYHHGPLSRIDISQATGLNKATVSSLVDDLISERFVDEIGYGTSSGGRKPVLLQFNARAGYCIGVDVQITYIKTVLTDMLGNIVDKRLKSLAPATGQLQQAQLEQLIRDEMEQVRDKAPTAPHGIIGAGIALPGIVNFKTGSAFYLPNTEIESWEAVKSLGKNFSFPIFIDNDGNCGALSEYRQRQIQNLVFINAGIGVGTGIVINGQLYRGANGIAGEYGHMTISAMGIPCACGSYGCWEQYASEQAFVRYLQEAEQLDESLELSPNLVSIAVKQARAKAGYRRAFTTLGHYLGIGMANIVNALNPAVIILGGTIGAAAPLFLDELKAVVHQRAMSLNKNVAIEVAHEDTVVIGASRLPISNTLLQNPLADG